VPAIHKIDLLSPGIGPLRAEALKEGHKFIEKLVGEWTTGENRFSAPGEILCGSIHQDLLVAVGGLNRDPFLDNPSIGRIRRVYVRPAWRKQGLGTAIIGWLLNHARRHYKCVRLRAENPAAARLYEKLGFMPIVDPNATHIFYFDTESG
jgi:GNAT superfamily N-acetyltransferase